MTKAFMGIYNERARNSELRSLTIGYPTQHVKPTANINVTDIADVRDDMIVALRTVHLRFGLNMIFAALLTL